MEKEEEKKKSVRENRLILASRAVQKMTMREGEAFVKGLVLLPFNSFIQASKL